MEFYKLLELIERFTINEGLIKTYPKEMLINKLRNEGFRVAERDGRIGLFIPKQNNITLDDINYIIDIYGYFVSFEHETANIKIFTLEPKFPEEIYDDGSCCYYHITWNVYEKSIFAIGLSPKTSKTSYKHPGNRIYLFKTVNTLPLKDLVEKMGENKSKLFDPLDKRRDYYKDPNNALVLLINVKGLKLYKDVMFAESENIPCYTKQNISPDRIIKKINYNEL
jgi:hypothetical protein